VTLIVIIAFFTGTLAGRELERVAIEAGWRPAPAVRVEAQQRQAALLCWHEFQSGRRATTADCPEL
jgi:hypothetical protein